LIAALATLVMSALFCGLYLGLARRGRFLDTPNERSSHAAPTPSGGGVPLFLAFFIGLGAVFAAGALDGRTYTALAAAAGLLVALGVADDLRGLSVRIRLVLYTLTCLGAVLYLQRDLLAAGELMALLTVPLAAVAMLWLLNLYNFMDGIDGIAGLQAVLACGGAALLSSDPGYALFCLLLAAAHGGFLCWNWPPARLFMGDAGSVPTGFLLGGLTLLGAVGGQLNPLCWAILLALFITDATWTLLWRMATGQPFTRAHRLHAYQRLSRHWGSHRAVDLLCAAVLLLWLFPLAWSARKWPEYGLVSVILAYLPLVVGMRQISHIK